MACFAQALDRRVRLACLCRIPTWHTSTDIISNDMRNFRKRIRGFRRVYGELVIRPVAGGSREDQARRRWRHHNRWFSVVVAVK
jgi:hypothetical protein